VKKSKLILSGNIEEFRQKQNEKDVVKPLLSHRCCKSLQVQLYKKIKNVDDSLKVCFITALEDYSQEFKESFPGLDEIKCFIRKLKAIEDLVNYIAAILG
jgi:hypothetical protein